MGLARESIHKEKRKPRLTHSRTGIKLVMDELSGRGFAAQLPKGMTKKYNLLVGTSDSTLKPIHVRTVHFSPWYVRSSIFVGDFADQVTVYVLLGIEVGAHARFFLVRNKELQDDFHQPPNWDGFGLIEVGALQKYENNLGILTN